MYTDLEMVECSYIFSVIHVVSLSPSASDEISRSDLRRESGP